ncbi:hypothetical protein BASA62_004236 [Batrachochytrium salamandrivorans]|nr:hypothetical protein BASA62_004236 [Batrachochytrium salamandrivorans]
MATDAKQAALDKQRSKEIDAMLHQEREMMKKYHDPKILLLGSGDSGKSTFVKQLRILHGGGYMEDERKSFRPVILENIRDAVVSLIYAAKENEVAIESENTKAAIAAIFDHYRIGKDALSIFKLNSRLANSIFTVWDDANMQRVYSERGHLENVVMIPDNTQYFLPLVAKFADMSYIPSNDDILHTRSMTTSISETNFEIESIKYRFFDVGGQQKYRKQWTPYFDTVDSILFIASVASYDQVLLEDTSTSRMVDAIELFGEIAHNVLLRHIPLTLFLNKKDLFESKIAYSDVVRHFPEFKGTPGNVKHAARFFQKQFESACMDQNKQVYIHFTCCTDTETMDIIVVTVIQAMLKKEFQDIGMLSDKLSTAALAEQTRISKQIDTMLNAERVRLLKEANKEAKILLLGSGDSGKTTFMKQLKIIHGGGYTDAERNEFRTTLFDNIADSTHSLIMAAAQLRISPKDKEVDPQRTLDPEIARQIDQFYHDENISSIFPLPPGSRVMIQDNALYFLSKVCEFSVPGYMPTNQDILNLRMPTTKISEILFHINNYNFRFYDIGGQQKLRKQWTPYFEHTHQILFFISLVSYDQYLAEDLTINRMHDALDLFGKICNHPLLKHIPITLFLNKKDLLEARLRESEVKRQFPDYTKENTMKYVCRFFEKKFLAQYDISGIREGDIKKIYTHVTCCTDTKAMDVIISNVV